MKYVYPTVLSRVDDVYNVEVPDLPGCFTFGKSLYDAIDMASDAIAMWICDAEDKNEPIPAPQNSEDIPTEHGQFISLVALDTDEYRRNNDNRAVKKTLTIPHWLNTKAEKAGVNFSQTLQKALKQELGV